MTVVEMDVLRAFRAGWLDGKRIRAKDKTEAMDLAEAIYAGNSIGAHACRKAYVTAYMRSQP